MTDKNHSKYMKMALNLAKKGEGHTSPNPMVGAVLVKKGQIIGKGYHKKAGLPHAEIEAFNDAKKKGNSVSGATLYVTLEPCCHTGKRTPPCTDAIIWEKVRKVFISTLDPNPQVSGKGVKILKKKGIDVEVGLLEHKSRRLNEYFNKYIVNKKPFVVLKMAVTLDGKIASRTGNSKWIGSDKQRRLAHIERAKVDAVMVGVNTITNDNSRLNVRLLRKRITHPVPVVLDSELRISPDSMVFVENDKVIVATTSSNQTKIKTLEKKGALVLKIRGNDDGMISIPDMLRVLGNMGISSILIEGGSSVAASALKCKIVDKIIFFYSPKIIGGDGLSMIGPLNKDSIKDAIEVKNVTYRRFNNEIMVEGYL